MIVSILFALFALFAVRRAYCIGVRVGRIRQVRLAVENAVDPVRIIVRHSDYACPLLDTSTDALERYAILDMAGERKIFEHVDNPISISVRGME